MTSDGFVTAKSIEPRLSLADLPYFPYSVIRPGQDNLINDSIKTLKEHKIIIAHAPTGLGKTASALSTAIQLALEQKKRIFFLTNRHTQHQIAIETLKLIKQKTGKNISCVDLIGKRWMCSQEIAGLFGNEFNEFCKAVVEKGECEFYNNVKTKKGLSVEAEKLLSDLKRDGPLHNEEIISLSKEKSMCSYEIAVSSAKEATILIGDYYYLFNPHVQSTLFNKMEISFEDIILIVDEGHNLPNRIMEMMSSNLTTYILKNAIHEAKKFGYAGIISWLDELIKIMNDLTHFESDEERINKEKKISKEKFIKLVSIAVDYDLLIEELDLAAEEIRKKQRRSYLGSIASFLEQWKGHDEGFTRIIAQKRGKQEDFIILSYSCLDPSIITKDIFSSIHAGIIMSGTLKPMFMYKDLLGISNAEEKEYLSPFPIENKCSLIIPETTTKFTARNESMYQKIADKCSELASLIPGNVAFFFPSYDLRDKIAYFIRSGKKKFFEKREMSKEEKEQFLAEFKDHKDHGGGILLGVAGANFAEGVDFPGDLLQGVVIVGLPLNKPDLKTKEIISYYQQKYNKGWEYGYIYPAMNKCLQSAGRCIRSETDKGATIFLDERFSWETYYACFPKEGLIVSKDYEKILKRFFA